MLEPPELVKELSDNLFNGVHECAICSEVIQRTAALWSCPCCYGVFHLRCVARWATSQSREREKQLRSSSGVEETDVVGRFPCPHCRALAELRSTVTYSCYCGQVSNPAVESLLVPGSCGQPCRRRRADPKCPHRCALLCHPGPCPPCAHTRPQACYCGKTTQTVGCSSGIGGFECGQTCDRVLDCTRHRCALPCHEGPCPVCREVDTVACYCGATRRTQRCAETPAFACAHRCTKMRDCGAHVCGRRCHAGGCEPCLRLPSRCQTCPCGKTPLTRPRTSCLDPIPPCGLPCALSLPCGHPCARRCHDDGVCGPCAVPRKQTCACGAQTFTVPCFCTYLPVEGWAAAAAALELAPESLPASYPPACTKPCRRALSCKKHKCDARCCTDPDHTCYRICVKKLSCGQHECGRLCHAGPCGACAHVSYERLYCRCGRSFLEPPVPCGAKPPRCEHPCAVPRPCGHPVNHPCHLEPDCPKCVWPVEKHCASHGTRMPYHMPCHLTEVSCGKRCGKALPCCGGACTRTCHGGPCEHRCAVKYPTFSEALRKGGQGGAGAR